MSHLGDRIVDFVFEELPAGEMAAARTHVAQCAECGARVDQFRRTQSLLQAAPDMDPPRSAVLTFERPRPARARRLGWFAPVAAALLLVVGIAWIAPVHFLREGSQLTIAFGDAPTPSAVLEEQRREIEQLQVELTYLARLHNQLEYETLKNTSSIQALAERRSPGAGD